MKLSLLYVVLVLISNLVSDTAQWNTVNFRNNLQMFENCLVHIAAIDIEGSDSNLIVEPLNFPVVQTRHMYQMFQFGPNKVHEMRQGTGFLFTSLPPPKLNCFVQVYLHEPSLDPRGYRRDLHDLDSRFFNMMFDHSIDYSEKYFEYLLVLSKESIYFIHVESKAFETEQLKDRHYIDVMFEHDTRRFFPIYDHPVKIFFLLEYSQKENLFEISNRVVQTCPDESSWFRAYRQRCGKYFHEDLSKVLHCVQSVDGPAPTSELVLYPDSVVNRELIENFRLICLHNRVISHGGKWKMSLSVQNLYISNWNRETEDDVDAIFLGMLFPNSTIMSQELATQIYPDVPQNIFQSTINPTFLSTRLDNIGFISCVPISKQPYLSLAGYVSAFDLNTWLLLGNSLCLSMLVWNYIVATSGKQFPIVNNFFFFNILVGQSTSEIQWAKWLTGSWILAGSFLTNNYQGNNIDQLTTPLTPTNIETFEEVFSNNLTVFSFPMRYKTLRPFLSPIMYLWFWDERLWTAGSLTISDIYLRNQVNVNLIDAKLALERMVIVPEYRSDGVKMMEFDFYVSKIAESGRDVFIDTYDRVEKVRFGLIKRHIKREQIATNKESYGVRYHFWKFIRTRIPAKVMDIRVLSFVQSGMFKLWKEWKFRIDTWNVTLEAAKLELPPSAKALSTNDNVVVVFYLHLGILSLSLILLLLECQKSLFRKVGDVLQPIIIPAKVCWNRCFWVKCMRGRHSNSLLTKILMVKTNGATAQQS